MYLVFDTETTGLPTDYKAPWSDTTNRPRMVQIGRILYDQDFRIINQQSLIIKPVGYTIPPEMTAIHGISTQDAIKSGKPLKSVLKKFLKDLEKSNTIVGHNIDFDINILGSELYRTKIQHKLLEKNSICTMQEGTSYCKIPGRGKSQYKRPKLDELHYSLFREDFDNAHNALADAQATARCFIKLCQIGHIKTDISDSISQDILQTNDNTLSLQFDCIASDALDMINHTNNNIFLTGKAGTGKSTLLTYFIQNTNKKVVVLAPTGVAALNVGGSTIHSFFGFPTTITYQEAQHKGISSKTKKLYTNTQTIIIDEISMVRADILDCIDIFLQGAKSCSQPFGGVQMIFIGDLYQLPPVVTSSDKEFFQTIYPSPYFFDAKVFSNPSWNMEFIELQTVYRQTDQSFVDILNSIRNKSINTDQLNKLNQNINNNIIDIPEGSIYLVGTNNKAQEINNKELYKLKTTSQFFDAMVDGKFQSRQYPTDEFLELKIGAQVMFVANDTFGRQRVNGTVGKIIGFEQEGVVVEIFGGETVIVGPHTREIKQYVYDKTTRSLSSNKIGSFTQIPLMLAWAITIHKSQGKTFDNVIIDLSGTFAHGQAYVALSRCRSLNGLCLVSPIQSHHIIMDHKVVNFINKYN